MERFDFASLDADGIKAHRQMGGPAFLQAASPARPSADAASQRDLVGSIGLALGWCLETVFACTFNVTAGQERLIRVYRQTGATTDFRREFGNLACGMGIEMRGVDGAA